MLFSLSTFTTLLVSSAALFGSVTNAAPIQLEERATCANGVHIISARGSTERAGEGSLATVSTKIKAQIPGSDSVGVVYPATLTNYASSESQGAAALAKAVNDYAAACPQTKIVLMGYSQGAQVVGDVLNGVTGRIPATTVKNIAAVIQLGDPSHKVGVSGNVGSSVRDGITPRRDTTKLALYNVQSYCDTGDVYCDRGNNQATHLGYISKYATQMANYVVSKANAFVVSA